MSYTITQFKSKAIAVTALFVATGLSSQTFEFEKINYEITDQRTAIVRGNVEFEGALVIPEQVEYEGVKYDVTEIGEEAFWNALSIGSVDLPKTIVNIQKKAFMGCKGLASVDLKPGVEYIGELAFSQTPITSIGLPESLKKIDTQAFEFCEEMTSLMLPETLEYIGKNAFSNTMIEDVKIPAAVTYIGDGAFASSVNLESFDVAIGNVTFASEDGVLFTKNKDVLLQYPNGKQEDSYVVPSSVKEIKDWAFYSASLSKITFNNNINRIGGWAFAQSHLTELELPDYMEYIGELAFSTMPELRKVALPKTLTYLGPAAFSNCESLEEVILPESLNELEKYVFSGCSALTSVVIPDNVKIIKEYAFGKAVNLADVTFPAELKTIEAFAFQYCDELKVITLPKNLDAIGERAFEITGLTEVKILADVPPTLDDSVFDAIAAIQDGTAVLKVPTGTARYYRRDEQWSQFKIEEDESLATVDVVATQGQGTKVYPNPTSGPLSIVVSEAQQATIFSIDGKAVKVVKLNKGENNVDITSQPAGVYILKLKNKIVKLLKK